MALCATVYPSFRCIKRLAESRLPPSLNIVQTSQAVSSRALSSEGPGPTTSDTEPAPGSTPDLSVQSPAHQLIDPFHPQLNRFMVNKRTHGISDSQKSSQINEKCSYQLRDSRFFRYKWRLKKEKSTNIKSDKQIHQFLRV